MNYNDMKKAMEERMINMQQQLTQCMEHKLEQMQKLDDQINETIELIESNKQQVNDINSQLELMNLYKKQLIEQKKGLLAENEDKILELKELKEKQDKDKFGKFINKTMEYVIPSDEETPKEVGIMEELIMNDVEYEKIIQELKKNK